MGKSKFAGKRILVVDDDHDVRGLVEAVLTRAGFQVTTASDGEDGRRKFLAEWHDMVFSDLTMPVMNGLALIQIVREIAPTTATVLFTTESKDLLDDGTIAHKILHKPASVIDIISTVDVAFVATTATTVPAE